MDTFNFNSDSYSDREIEKLLHLSQPYNSSDITRAKQVLTKQLANNNTLGVEKQREVAFFIDTIAMRIMNVSVSMSEPSGSMVDASHRVIQQGSNFIIENPDVFAGRSAKNENGRMSAESKSVPAGNLNPINVRTITQAISLDSRFRPNYYSSKSTNYDVVLPSIQKNVVSMRVTSIELPITYYAVSQSSENATCLIIDASDNSIAWRLTLPDGNYEQLWAKNSNAADIEAAMNDAIINAAPVTLNTNGTVATRVGAALTAVDLLFILDHISGRSIFDASGGIFNTDGYILRFDVDNAGNLNGSATIQMRLGWQLGFRAAKYVATLRQVISEGICLIAGPRYAFISINDYQKNTGPTHVVTYANSIMQDNIITRLNLAELQADFGVYQCSSDPGLSTQLNRMREYFGPVDIQRLHIALYDEFGRVIDLNNMDWSLTLAFEILYN